MLPGLRHGVQAGPTLKRQLLDRDRARQPGKQRTKPQCLHGGLPERSAVRYNALPRRREPWLGIHIGSLTTPHAQAAGDSSELLCSLSRTSHDDVSCFAGACLDSRPGLTASPQADRASLGVPTEPLGFCGSHRELALITKFRPEPYIPMPKGGGFTAPFGNRDRGGLFQVSRLSFCPDL